MAADILPDRQYAMPPAADGAACVLPGVAWGNSDYETLDTPDADSVLTGIVIRPTGTIFTGYELRVDIATGAEGFEGTPIATFPAYLQEVLGSVGSDGLYLPTIIGIDGLPSGARVATRCRANTTTTPTLHISGTYLKKPLAGTLLTTTNPLLDYPFDDDNVVVLGGTPAWTTGTPVEIFDDSGPALAVVIAIGKIDQATTQWELDICTGPGDDVATTLSGAGAGVSSFPNKLSLEHPLILPAATRVSVQARTDPQGLNVLFAMGYFELPL